MRTIIRRKFGYGDYIGKPDTSELTRMQVNDPFNNYQQRPITSNTSQGSNGSIFKNQSFGNYLGLIGDNLSNSKQFNENSFTDSRNNTKQNVNSALNVVSTAFPVVGGFMKVGSAIGETTMNKDGIYKGGSSFGQHANAFIDQSINPVTGIQQLGDFAKDISWDTALSQFTAGILGTSATQKRAKRAAQEAHNKYISQIERNSQGVLANYPTMGYGKYGMKFPYGGNLPEPTDDSDQEQIASDMAQYKGATHENGGIDLDTDNDGNPNIEIEHNEVIKDNKVLSDRLSPSDEVKNHLRSFGIKIKDSDTYASLSARLGKLKGNYEENLNSTRTGQKNSAQIMTDRLDSAIELLFQDQQVQNGDGMDNEQYKHGGIYIKPSHRGRFTNYLHRTGKTLTEALHSNNPHVRQMANFARNAKKWHHGFGGYYAGGGEIDPIQRAAYRRTGEIPGFNSQPLEDGTVRYTNPKLRIDQSNPDYFYTKRGEQGYIGDPNASISSKLLFDQYPEAVAAHGYTRQYLNNAGQLVSDAPIAGFDLKTRDIPTTTNIAPLSNISTTPVRGTKVVSNKRIGEPYTVESFALKQAKFGNFKNLPGTNGRLEFRNNRPLALPQQAYGGVYYAKGGKFANFLSENEGNIYNAVGTGINQGLINSLETNITPEISPNPQYAYQDRIPFLRNEVNNQFRTATQGLNYGSAQDNMALKSNLYAQSLDALNRSYDSELQRKNNFDAYYNQLVSQNNQFNTQSKNFAKQLSMDNRNQKKALTQANIDNFIQGAIGNSTQKDVRQLDWDRAYIDALKSGDRGVLERIMNNMPEEIRKRRFGNYRTTVKN